MRRLKFQNKYRFSKKCIKCEDCYDRSVEYIIYRGNYCKKHADRIREIETEEAEEDKRIDAEIAAYEANRKESDISRIIDNKWRVSIRSTLKDPLDKSDQ